MRVLQPGEVLAGPGTEDFPLPRVRAGRPLRAFDWTGLLAVLSDRARSVVALTLPVLRVCGEPVGTLSDPS